jgi:acyl-CoA thioester hydrolase
VAPGAAAKAWNPRHGQAHYLSNFMAVEAPDRLSVLEIRVYYEDTDAVGVVYYANYLKFFERGRTEWLRRLGVDQSELAQREHRMFVVRRVKVDYRKPARLDDLIAVHSQITRVGSASIDFEQRIACGAELLCQSDIQICCVDTNRFRPAAFSHDLRTLLQKVQK